jgi:hypothetical protein
MQLIADEQSKLDAGVAWVTEWLMKFQESPKEKAPVKDIFRKECRGFTLCCLYDPF